MIKNTLANFLLIFLEVFIVISIISWFSGIKPVQASLESKIKKISNEQIEIKRKVTDIEDSIKLSRFK